MRDILELKQKVEDVNATMKEKLSVYNSSKNINYLTSLLNKKNEKLEGKSLSELLEGYRGELLAISSSEYFANNIIENICDILGEIVKKVIEKVEFYKLSSKDVKKMLDKIVDVV